MKQKTNFVKRFGSVTLAGLTFFGLCFGLVPLFEKNGVFSANANNVIEASADTSYLQDAEKGDTNFTFTTGASIKIDEDEDTIEGLKFGIQLKNRDFENFLNHNKDRAETEFTLYRQESAGFKAIYKIGAIALKDSDGHSMIFFGHQTLAYENNEGVDENSAIGSSINIFPNQFVGDIVLDATKQDEMSEKELQSFDLCEAVMENCGYTLDWVVARKKGNHDEKFFMYEDDYEGIPSIGVTLFPNSPKASYFVDMKYVYYDYQKSTTTGALWWKETKDVFNISANILRSDTRSIVSVLSNMRAANALEEEMKNDEGLIKTANTILDNSGKYDIKITYLKQIKNTPLAQKVTKSVKANLYGGNTLLYDDAAIAVGEELHCLGSNVKEFIYDADTGTYVAKYLTAMKVIARTEDGNSLDYWLDINTSYYDYFQDLLTAATDSGVAKMYEYFLSSWIARYPEISGISEKELYGYFGHVVIPNTYSWATLWNEVFQVPTEFKGVIEKESYQSNMSLAAYNRLLRDYDYSWYERIYSTVYSLLEQGLKVSSVHWIFLANPKIQTPVISENGSTAEDNDFSSIGNGIKDVVDTVVDTVTGTTENIQQATQDMSAIEESLASLKLILGVAVGGGAVFAVILLVSRRKKK